MSIEDSLEFLKTKYKMFVMSNSGDRKWFNLASDCGVGCILKEEEGNVTFMMCFTLSYGQFNYTTMNTAHLGTASDAAHQRTLKAYRSIPKLT